MLTKIQFQTLFGFKPKRRSASKAGKKVVRKTAKKSTRKTASKAGKRVVKKSNKKIVKKSNKIGTRIIKGVKRTVYKGKNGGKFYRKANGRKVYFGLSTSAVANTVSVIGAKAAEGAGYTLGYTAANIGTSMLKKVTKKKKSKMGKKKSINKSGKKVVRKTAKKSKRKTQRKSRVNRFGNHGYAGLDSMMGPSPNMFASHTPIF